MAGASALVAGAVFALALTSGSAPRPASRPPPAHVPAPAIPAPSPEPYGGRFAPGVFGADGVLALPDGRYAGRLVIESGFDGLEDGAPCVVEIQNDDASCTLEIGCGGRTLYAVHDSPSLRCGRGSDGGTTALTDRTLARDDGSPFLDLQHGTEGYRFELSDIGGLGFDRAVVVLARGPAPGVL